jgi:hypothetical protein
MFPGIGTLGTIRQGDGGEVAEGDRRGDRSGQGYLEMLQLTR